MRWILLLISSCVIASAQDCGPENPDCKVVYYKKVEVGKGLPNSTFNQQGCWWLNENPTTREKEYCHQGKNLTIQSTNKDRTVNVDCGGLTLDCSWLPTLNFTKNGQLDVLILYNCSMDGSISCVLRALNVKMLNMLSLEYWKTEITTETVRELDVDGPKIFGVFDADAVTRIPVEAFKQLPALQKIRMEGNNIRDIPAQAFSELGALNITFLEISRAKLTELKPGAFLGLQKLNHLMLIDHGIKTVDKDAFKGLPLLKDLVLTKNAIEDLPAGLFNYTHNLETLEIRYNRADLRLKKDTLPGLKKLKELWITMYNETYRLSLEEQSLSYLPSLTCCNLSEAGLTELPKDLFKGSQALERLILDVNDLKLLPENVFKELVNLKELNVSNNTLQDIDNNPFSTTDKLETLNLAGNSLKNLPVKLFEITQGAPSLKNLDLSYNQLNFECRTVNRYKDDFRKYIHLHESPLRTLKNTLKTLDLSHNNMTSLCDDFLTSWTLKMLNLSHNKISALTSKDLQFVGNRTIDLRYNQITSIQPTITQKELNANLLLGNNPYNCDCTNFKMLRELKNFKYNMSEANCNEPKSLKGVPLISIAEAINSTSLDNLTCVLSDTPNNCECLARPSIHMTECTCDEVVTNLPDPNDNKTHYLIDQEGEVTTKYNMLLKLKTKDLLFTKLENIPNFVTNLILTNLALTTIPNIPEHIRYVDLTYNNLEGIPRELLSRKITFSLSHNPFQCTCAGQSDIKNLQNYKDKINNYSSLECHDGFPIENVQVSNLCNVVYSVAIAFAIGIIIAVLVILVYKYQLEIKIWLYNQGWTFGLFNYETALDASKKYDIFLSYCHEDEDYVVNELLPFMDEKYKVCVHTRDFIPGEDIMTQIYRAVADSRRTVIVASNAYFRSPWCLEEMRAAYKQTEVDQRLRAVVILRTDVDPRSEDISDTVRSYLNLNTWIGEKDTRFWYRLCYFLPRNVTVEDLRLIEVTNEAKKNLSDQLNKVFVHDGKLGIDNETGEVNGNLVRNLCKEGKADIIPDFNDEVHLAKNNLPRVLCNSGKLDKNLPETLNVVHNEDGKLVNVAVVKDDRVSTDPKMC